MRGRGSGKSLDFQKLKWPWNDYLCNLFLELFSCAEYEDAKVVDMCFWCDSSWWWDIPIVEERLTEDDVAQLADLLAILQGVEAN